MITPATDHSLLDRLLGSHHWQLTSAQWVYRGGGWAHFYYDCGCGAKRKTFWPGEYEAGRKLSDEERAALGPYPI